MPQEPASASGGLGANAETEPLSPVTLAADEDVPAGPEEKEEDAVTIMPSWDEGVAYGIDLETLAREAGWSVPHLHDRFQAHLGISPHQWLMRRRLHAARQLLAATDQPIAEIAGACGFADAAAFCRAFKRGEGTSPAAWRRLGRLAPR